MIAGGFEQREVRRRAREGGEQGGLVEEEEEEAKRRARRWGKGRGERKKEEEPYGRRHAVGYIGFAFPPQPSTVQYNTLTHTRTYTRECERAPNIAKRSVKGHVDVRACQIIICNCRVG